MSSFLHNYSFFSIVVSFLLTTIVSCSSVKKQRNTIKEQSAVKEQVVLNVKKDSSSNSNSLVVSDYKFSSDNLDIDYTPEFDLQGNLIPLHFKAVDKTGKETNVSIQGNAKIRYNTNTESSNKIEEKNESFTNSVNILEKRIKELEESNSKLISEKSKQPDYFKYLIWIGIGFTFLAAIIIGLYIYFRVTIGKYKTLLNNIIK